MAKQWVAKDFGDVQNVLELVDREVPAPQEGEVTISVTAVGMNPADFKYLAAPMGRDQSDLPLPLGYEVAGTIKAIGPNTTIGSGGGAVGDTVMAFRVSDGYSTELTTKASNAFAKPANLSDAEAANLFLVGATAADMIRVIDVTAGDTVVIHGASSSCGVSLMQQLAKLGGIRVIGTAREKNFDLVTRFGGTPVAYGDGLENRLRALAPDGYVASFDCVGTDEAIDVSLALIKEPKQIVSIAAFNRGDSGISLVGGSMPESAKYRDQVRAHLVDLAASGELVVPVAKTFAFDDALEAFKLLQSTHPGGKLALIP